LHRNEVAFLSVDSSFQLLSTVSFGKEKRTGGEIYFKNLSPTLKRLASKMTAKQILKDSVLEDCGEKY